jgi:hypothetical protein
MKSASNTVITIKIEQIEQIEINRTNRNETKITSSIFILCMIENYY